MELINSTAQSTQIHDLTFFLDSLYIEKLTQKFSWILELYTIFNEINK
jgi:hypothetical protein